MVAWYRVGLAVVLVTLMLGLATAAVADPPDRVGRLSYLRGAVSFLPAQAGDPNAWVPATLNYPVTSGDSLWADRDAWAEVQLGPAVARLAPLTSARVVTLDDRVAQFGVAQGALLVSLRQQGPGEVFEVDTPHGAVTLNGPGVYRITVDPASVRTVVTVRQGQASIVAAAGMVPVAAGQAVWVGGGEPAELQLQTPEPPDAWEAWADARDRREARLAALRYVSPDMVGYQELDDYGRWQVDAVYGPVWVPTVTVGWAPYRTGHWAWVRPWGWTWVDDAPWGFAPFHYGRWICRTGTWAWAPGPLLARPVYAPALVAFVGGGDLGVAIGVGSPAVGWFPLAPGEVYVPPYTASAKYVRALNANHVKATSLDLAHLDVGALKYANRTVAGAVTAVPTEDLARARKVTPAAVVVPPSVADRAKVIGMAPPVTPRRDIGPVRLPTETPRPVLRPADVVPPRAPDGARITPAPLEPRPRPVIRPADPAVELPRPKELPRPPLASRPAESAPRPAPVSTAPPSPGKAIDLPAPRGPVPGRDAGSLVPGASVPAPRRPEPRVTAPEPRGPAPRPMPAPESSAPAAPKEMPGRVLRPPAVVPAPPQGLAPERAVAPTAAAPRAPVAPAASAGPLPGRAGDVAAKRPPAAAPAESPPQRLRSPGIGTAPTGDATAPGRPNGGGNGVRAGGVPNGKGRDAQGG
jgi:hypothetical protein